MELKSEYKKTEVGIIPKDWQFGKLGDITTNISSGISKTKSTIGIYNIYGSTGIIGSSSTYDYTGEKILVARVGANAGTVNQVDGKYCVSDNTLIINLKPNFELVYFFYFLIYIKLNKLIFGSGQPLITGSQLKSLPIPLPPLPEQKTIATAISDINALITSLEKLIEKKRKIKQGTMQELLTGKRRLPGFTGKWEKKRLGDIFHFSGGYTASREELSTEGFCYLHYGDIHGAKKTYIDVQEEYVNIPKLTVQINQVSAKSLLNDGDIVFVDASEDDEGTSRHVVVKNNNKTPFISGLHTIVAKSIDDTLDNVFKRYCFQSEAIRRQFIYYAVGTKVSGISKKNIVKILLSVPAKSEQAAIASILSDMDTEIESFEKKLDKYRAIKQGMMQVLLTGKIRLVDK